MNCCAIGCVHQRLATRRAAKRGQELLRQLTRENRVLPTAVSRATAWPIAGKLNSSSLFPLHLPRLNEFPIHRLRRRDINRQLLRPAQDLNRYSHMHFLVGQQPLQIVDRSHRLTVEGDDQVSINQSGFGSRAVRFDADDQHTRLHFQICGSGTRATVQRDVLPGDADIASRDAAIADQSCRDELRPVADGMAKQIPCAAGMIAVFTPTTRPCESTSGPPEFPGFSAASV